MWDTVQTNDQHLSHDLPCPRCGHEVHTFLACGDDCACPPALLPIMPTRWRFHFAACARTLRIARCASPSITGWR